MNKAKFGPMLLALALFAIFLLIPTRFLLPLLSDEKVEQAATSLKEEKIQSMILQQKMLADSNTFRCMVHRNSHVWMLTIHQIISK